MATPAPDDTLAALAVGTSGRIRTVDLPPGDRLRLAELGLRPGVSLTVLGRTPGGGRLVSFETSRVALDHATTRGIATEAL